MKRHEEYAHFGDADEITKHDTEANVWQAIYVGGTGNVKVRTQAGTTVLFESVPAGAIIPIAVNLVYSTDTTATKMVGFRN